MENTKIPMPQITVKPLSHEELHNALLYVQDALERSMIPFFLLDDIAKEIVDHELPTFKASEISIGIKERHLTQDTKSLFRMWVPQAEFTPTTISLTYGRVPIVVWIIQRKYKFFENPDIRFYTTTEFWIPNPFALYWKSRFLIK